MNLKAMVFSLIVFVLFGGGFMRLSDIHAGTESIEQSRNNNNNRGNSSFGRAYREAVRKGLSTFTWNGKKYTTEKRGSNNNNRNVTRRNNNRQTTATYTNVSFSRAYGDARRKGLSTFTWNGKKYTTDNSNTRVSNRTSRNVRNNRNTRVNRNRNTRVNRNRNSTVNRRNSNVRRNNRNTTVNRRTNTTRRNTTRTNTGTYTPPRTYGNENSSGRDFQRSGSNTNTGSDFIRKEPKRD